MKTLVTGSGGFVGRHLVDACLARGHEVTCIEIDEGADALDFFRMSPKRFDLVLHCAAIVGGRRLIDGSPAYLIAENAMLDAAMFEWALRSQPRDVVYYSSSAAYPLYLQSGAFIDRADRLHEAYITLNLPEKPETSYGQGKLNGEQIARYVRDEGVRVHVLRPFSGYGSDQSLDYPFPSFIDRARRRADPFEIWGSGEQVRDWIHIDDIVGATLAAIEQDEPVTSNLCTGRGTTFNQLANLCAVAAGYVPEFKHLGDQAKGVDYRVGDPTEMLKFYEPKISIEQGVMRALRV